VGSALGAEKIAAVRVGVSHEEYRRQIAAGRRWCTACKEWHAVGDFGRDPNRKSGIDTKCITSRRVAVRKKPGFAKGAYRHGWLKASRPGDKRQARRRINYLVEQGRIPPPNALPCCDCSHEWRNGERRHEYDHHLGYAVEHHLDVQPVCTSCHKRREASRRREALGKV
jgi:hypothetical protein